MKLIQIGVSNWDIYLDDNKPTLWAEPKKCKRGNGCSSSVFGNKQHLIRLMNESILYDQKYNFDGFTVDGLEFLSGLTQNIETRIFRI